MRTLPLNIGTIHFVGIGGIGMSGIAEVLNNLGYTVQGSDLAESANVKRLRTQGIEVEIGHRAENLRDARVVVVSSAVKRDNPELMAARLAHLPVVRRAEMLGELMRLKWSVAVGGTHGKTTTTSMVAAMFEAAALDPTVINGGIINAYGTNSRLGAGQWMVVEADESDGTFLKLPATICVVTNIDPEHLDHYQSFDRIRDAFDTFVQNLPFYGFAVLCLDHPEVQAMVPRVSDRRVITYGFSPQADVRAVNVELTRDGAKFDVEIHPRGAAWPKSIAGVTLPMFGNHNIQNCLAAFAIGHEMGFDAEVMRRAMAGFGGVKRRFTRVGESNGVTIIDDYAHHPVEITAVLRAARQASQGRVIAVVQPHRYTRLKSLFEEFCTCLSEADAVVVAEVYPAGEPPLPGVSRDALVEAMRLRGHKQVVPLDGPEHLAPLLCELARPGDLVVCLGAGSISTWANALPPEMDRIYGIDPEGERVPAFFAGGVVP